jgi:hypothetical protein
MAKLEPEDLKVIYRLLNWEKTGKTYETIVNNLILFIGGLLLVVSVYRIISDPFKTNSIYVVASGLLSGLLFLWFYWVSRKRFNEKLELIHILKKIIKNEDKDLSL